MKKIFLLICLLTGMVCMQETNLFGLQTICAEPQNAAPKVYSVTMLNQDMNFMYRDYDNISTTSGSKHIRKMIKQSISANH